MAALNLRTRKRKPLTVQATCYVCARKRITCTEQIDEQGVTSGYTFPDHRYLGRLCTRSGHYVTIGETI